MNLDRMAWNGCQHMFATCSRQRRQAMLDAFGECLDRARASYS
ncbi:MULTISPECIES: hypothetical protein [Novosphingobium]|nr:MULTISPECIES: hypothetical protein [Novosphingobium]